MEGSIVKVAWTVLGHMTLWCLQVRIVIVEWWIVSHIQLSTQPQDNYLQLVTLCIIQFKITEGVDCEEIPFVIPDKEPNFESTLQINKNM